MVQLIERMTIFIPLETIPSKYDFFTDKIGLLWTSGCELGFI